MRNLMLFLALLSAPLFASQVSTSGGGTLPVCTDGEIPVWSGSGFICGSPTGTGDVTGPASSVDSEIALFSSTSGKAIKRATGTGLCKATSGVASFATLVNADVSASAAIAFSKLEALSSANILVGNGSNVATAVAVSGEASISNAGAVTLSTTGVTGKALTGFSAGAGTVSATDTILQAFNKVWGWITSLQVEVITGHLEAPTAKTLVLDQSAAYAYTVNSIISQCTSGTVDFDLEIDGTDVTGCASQQMASSEATDTCSAANAVAVGNTLGLNITAVSSPVDCRFTLKYTR